MSPKRIGVAVSGNGAREALAGIRRLERLDVQAAWLTAGGTNRDSLTVLAAAAVQTRRIMLGTSIVPTWPRHPLALAQQAGALAQLAGGRFRLGVGPGHQARVEGSYGLEFKDPLGHLREYVRILKAVLQRGAVEFDGRYYHARWQTETPTDVPVMISALRRGSFELAGAEADGAITWLCPPRYLGAVALPAMQAGAQRARRPVPPLIAHAPVCVHDDLQASRTAAREQLAGYLRTPFYVQMLTQAGFPEAAQGAWSDAMLDAVLVAGDEETVAARLQGLFDLGAAEVLVAPIAAGLKPKASLERTLRLVAQVAESLESRR